MRLPLRSLMEATGQRILEYTGLDVQTVVPLAKMQNFLSPKKTEPS